MILNALAYCGKGINKIVMVTVMVRVRVRVRLSFSRIEILTQEELV